MMDKPLDRLIAGMCFRPDGSLNWFGKIAALSALLFGMSLVALIASATGGCIPAFADGVDDEETAKVKWTGDWGAEGATHAGPVEIPAKYRGRPACLYENVTLGDAEGLFDFGSIEVAIGTRPAWNGVATNALTGAEVKVDNGFFKKGAN